MRSVKVWLAALALGVAASAGVLVAERDAHRLKEEEKEAKLRDVVRARVELDQEVALASRSRTVAAEERTLAAKRQFQAHKDMLQRAWAVRGGELEKCLGRSEAAHRPALEAALTEARRSLECVALGFPWTKPPRPFDLYPMNLRCVTVP